MSHHKHVVSMCLIFKHQQGRIPHREISDKADVTDSYRRHKPLTRPWAVDKTTAESVGCQDPAGGRTRTSGTEVSRDLPEVQQPQVKPVINDSM
jgi:hypothetical protein